MPRLGSVTPSRATRGAAERSGHPGPDAAERAVALQVDPIDGGATRGLAAEIRQDIKQGIKEVKEELEETFLTKLQQDHQELEQVKQHLSQELQMQQILPQLLEASASHSRASGAPGSPRGSAAKAERHFLAAFQRQHVEDGSGQFELCKDVSRTSQRKKPMASMEIGGDVGPITTPPPAQPLRAAAALPGPRRHLPAAPPEEGGPCTRRRTCPGAQWVTRGHPPQPTRHPLHYPQVPRDPLCP